MNTTCRFLLVSALFALCTFASAAETEVSIPTADPAVVLAGTLLVPDGVERPPVAVLVTGTGNHTRDQVISRLPMFKVLAEELRAAGIASLRVDSRGSGGSTGPKALESTTPDRIEDTRAVVAWLRDAAHGPLGHIGLVGHSEGAAIAAELVREPGVEWAVLLGAPARPGREVWVEQQAAPAEAELEGDPAAQARVRALLELAAAQSVQGEGGEVLEATAVDLFGVLGIDEATARGDGSIENFASRMTDNWMRGFLAYDPQPALARLAGPVLAVYGSHDRFTTPAQNAGRLVELAAAGGEADLTVRILPRQDHFFLESQGREPGDHKAGEMMLAPDLVEALVDWINANAR
ncbi:alpha/beta hydrolase [Luteimonas sp. JM171]|uniref:alpha/beta hydrolase n=1 Tax=Luteimonas sp. JM171 TaxID=1896164 RepID=UPI00085753E2|nr:alpha/beta fold hydrolase [Luteimonas sp. JM171]AOH37146.1 hypothetical protein BGP89_12965 [Luteimonas sp. JM171]